MNLAKQLKKISALTIFSGLLSPAVYAHPGHDTANMLHGVLHLEHLLILLAIGVVIAIRFFIKE
jgi:hydrogenase/urease accessory protein HupE